MDSILTAKVTSNTRLSVGKINTLFLGKLTLIWKYKIEQVQWGFLVSFCSRGSKVVKSSQPCEKAKSIEDKKWIDSSYFVFLGIKHSTSVLVKTLKTRVFAKFCGKFLAFSPFFGFGIKNCCIFQQAFGCCAFLTLVKIYNMTLNTLVGPTRQDPVLHLYNGQ